MPGFGDARPLKEAPGCPSRRNPRSQPPADRCDSVSKILPFPSGIRGPPARPGRAPRLNRDRAHRGPPAPSSHQPRLDGGDGSCLSPFCFPFQATFLLSHLLNVKITGGQSPRFSAGSPRNASRPANDRCGMVGSLRR